MTEPHPIYADPTGPELMPLRRPDMTLGTLSLWFEGPQGSNGWVDVVVYVGDHFQTLAHRRGPLLLKSDLVAFAASLVDLLGRKEGEIFLPSTGHSLGLAIRRRSPPFGSSCEVALNSFTGDQRISLRCGEAELARAAEGLVAALARLEQARAQGWRPALLDGAPEAREALTRLVGPVGSKPAPDKPTRPPPEPPPPRPDAPDPEFTFEVTDLGWHSLTVRVGDAVCEMGGSDIGEGLDHLLRAALALAAGAPRAEVVFNAEPFLTRIAFDALYGSGDLPPHLPCRVRVEDLSGYEGAPDGIMLDAVCASGLGVAIALYRMALPHFVDNDPADGLAFAALEGALAGIGRAQASRASGLP